MGSYEAERLENIKRNQELLAELNLKNVAKFKAEQDTDDKLPAKKKRKIAAVDNIPTRISARIASAPSKPIYNEDENIKEALSAARRATARPATAKKGLRKSKAEDERIVVESRLPTPPQDIDDIQRGWTDWKPTGAEPTRDERGTIHFDDEPSFTPNKTPEEMLREGCFGGTYFRPLKSRKLGIVVQDDWRELPSSWTDGLDVDTVLVSTEYDPEVNKYKVSCGQTIEEWEAAGWINHTYDVRGWFQWYCRFYMGRRCDDDDRQISRWRKCVGETGRWRRMLLKKYGALGVRSVFADQEEEDDEDAPEVSPVVHQTCHHWAFEVRQEDLDEFWAERGR